MAPRVVLQSTKMESLREELTPGSCSEPPQNGVLYHSYSLLKDDCTDNEAKYEALIIGLVIALDIRILHLHAYGNSQLLIGQLDIYEVRKPELVPYYQKAKQLMEGFTFIEVAYVS